MRPGNENIMGVIIPGFGGTWHRKQDKFVLSWKALSFHFRGLIKNQGPCPLPETFLQHNSSNLRFPLRRTPNKWYCIRGRWETLMQLEPGKLRGSHVYTGWLEHGGKVLFRWLHSWLSGREQWLSPRRPHLRGNAGCQEGRRRIEGFWQVPGRTVQYLHDRIENITYQEPKGIQEWDVSAQNHLLTRTNARRETWSDGPHLSEVFMFYTGAWIVPSLITSVWTTKDVTPGSSLLST